MWNQQKQRVETHGGPWVIKTTQLECLSKWKPPVESQWADKKDIRRSSSDHLMKSVYVGTIIESDDTTHRRGIVWYSNSEFPYRLNASH